MGLAEVFLLAKRQQSIVELLETKLGESTDVPPLDDSSALRISGLAHLCAREEVLRAVNHVAKKDKVTADLSLIFAHGTALHWVLQNRLLPVLGVLLGKWKCHGCGETQGELGKELATSLSLRPVTCFRCGGKEFLYEELYFFDPVLRVGGHPDGFLRLPGLPGVGVFEAKSISERGFRSVRDLPMIDHVVQIQMYLSMTRLQWGKILYWNKAGNGLGALKEHLVERDEEMIDNVHQMVRSIWQGVRTGDLPDRICTIANCPRARDCSVADLCFQGGVRTDV
jgi:hypothetical protein